MTQIHNNKNSTVPILFRWHRHALEDSIATVQEIKNFADLEILIGEKFGLSSIDQIEVKYFGYDDRIQWNCYLVTLNGNNVGFTNQALEKPSSAL